VEPLIAFFESRLWHFRVVVALKAFLSEVYFPEIGVHLEWKEYPPSKEITRHKLLKVKLHLNQVFFLTRS